ncbi:MAG: rod shape-determining protein [Candidatus Methanoperedens sp.]|nr:rod shape-determining protein [Candidatus Methanoperedens sp.]
MASKNIIKPVTSTVKDNKSLYIGVDLGTNHTAISTSDGKKNTILSVVGTPRDAVASKFLKKEHLYGEDALSHRVALNLLKPIENGVMKNQKEDIEAAKGLLEHVMQSIKVQKDIKKYAIIGVPAQASVLNKKIIIDMAHELFDGVMVASEPFCVAYKLGQLEHSLVVDIGAGTTDLCRVHGTLPDPEDQITSTKAGNYIDREFVRLISESYTDVSVTLEMARKWKEQHSFVGNIEKEIIVEVPVESSFLKLPIAKEMKNACESILPDITIGISKLISTYEPDFQDDLRNNIWLAGGGSQMRNLAKVLEHQLELIGGGKIQNFKDPVYGGADGALKLAMDMPTEFWQTI